MTLRPTGVQKYADDEPVPDQDYTRLLTDKFSTGNRSELDKEPFEFFVVGDNEEVYGVYAEEMEEV